MSDLTGILDDYLALRRSVGFRLDHLGHQLPKFVSFLESEGADTITTDLALRWAGQRRQAGKRLGAVRVFARYVQAIDPRTEVPPADLLSQRTQRRVPRLLAESEVVALMNACGSIEPAFWAKTVETIVGLLWATGMRVGEVLRLEEADVSFSDCLLVVQYSKSNKSRLVPLASSSLRALSSYARDRKVISPGTATFFVSGRGHPVQYEKLRAGFKDAAHRATLSSRPPRLGDFRHSFAVRTLLGWYRSGEDVQAMIPRLSTYLGHVGPASTYWYLSTAPELMAIVAERLESSERARP
jgi:integrase/recombinase XerD